MVELAIFPTHFQKLRTFYPPSKGDNRPEIAVSEQPSSLLSMLSGEDGYHAWLHIIFCRSLVQTSPLPAPLGMRCGAGLTTPNVKRLITPLGSTSSTTPSPLTPGGRSMNIAMDILVRALWCNEVKAQICTCDLIWGQSCGPYMVWGQSTDLYMYMQAKYRSVYTWYEVTELIVVRTWYEVKVQVRTLWFFIAIQIAEVEIRLWICVYG